MSKKIITIPSFTPAARDFWESLPPGIDQRLLDNVFCGNCRGAVRIVDYSGEIVGGDLVLKGKCATCGGPVVRLIEGPEPMATAGNKQHPGDLEERFYLLRVSLRDIDPEIWRRFMVPGSITLDRLHDVLQIVMGWQDCHIHQFTIARKNYTEHPDRDYPEIGAWEGEFRLLDLVRQKGRSFNYLYDFGDGWEHEVQVENSRYYPRDIRYPLWCLEGQGACPPEDVGGLPGYAGFCQAMADRRHSAHKQFCEWYGERQRKGGGFDPAFFDRDRVNDDLVKYQNWTRDRVLPKGAWEI